MKNKKVIVVGATGMLGNQIVNVRAYCADRGLI